MTALQDMELSGGLPLDKDLVLAEAPVDPEMREGVSVWLYEEQGAFGFPRMGIEAVGENWNRRPLQMNIALPGGRVLTGSGLGTAHPALDDNSRPTIFGAGGLSFRCVEPFRRWTVSFEGPAVDTDYSAQISGTVDTSRQTRVRLDADLTMAAPSWVQVFGDGEEKLEASLMGLGYRYEQLLRAEGVFEIDGEKRPFKGVGLRIHRQSIRRLDGFYGHCWQSAIFPDGSAFAINVFPERDDGPQYNTGYIYKNGRMVEARATRCSWLEELVGPGEDVSIELESEFGRTQIKGTTLFATFVLGNPEMQGKRLFQGGARYEWDGQTAVGMVERSL